MSGLRLLKVSDNKLKLQGELNAETLLLVLKEGSFWLQEAHEQIAIDLADISRCNSAGLALLIEWFRVARAHQRQIHYTNLPEQMINIAKVSGLDKILPFAS